MRSIDVAVIGGGPAGLFLARLLRRDDPNSTVTVYERNGADAAFGFGVVFSDRTMSAVELADPETHELIGDASVSWTDMEMRVGASALRYGGYGFTAISRRVLLRILQDQAVAAGVRLRFHSTVDADTADADVVVVAEGVNSAFRDAHAQELGTRVSTGSARYIWFGTPAPFDAVVFPFVTTEHGSFAAHAYPYGGGMSTFIVETDVASWSAAGMDTSPTADPPPGEDDQYTRRYLSAAFAEHLGGAPLIGNSSRWSSFRVVHNETWWRENRVLLGDAAHTAHFSVGSGTKMAMEDAISLSAALLSERSPEIAFAAYHRERRPAIARIQDAAAASMRWWESFAGRLTMPTEQFGLHFMTRTGAIGYAGLRRRHAAQVDEAERAFVERAAGSPGSGGKVVELPLMLGPVRLAGRLVAVLDEAPPADVVPAGVALMLVDLRGRCDAAVRLRRSTSATDQDGCAVGVLVKDPVADVAALVGAGARVVGVVVDPASGDLPPTFGGLREAVGPDVALVGVIEGAGSDERAALCRRLAAAGADGVYLRVPDGSATGWLRSLEEADRTKAETGLTVLVDGPDTAAATHARPAADPLERAHLALVTGRTDMVATSAHIRRGLL